MLSTYLVMCVPMIVFYIEVNMQTKRYVPNVRMRHDKYKESNNKAKAHGPPHKILRHMPIIPRIQRLFRCKVLSRLYGWHTKY